MVEWGSPKPLIVVRLHVALQNKRYVRIMTNPLDNLISAQEKKLQRLTDGTFWSRNKKLIITIVLILIVLSVLSMSYVNFWLPRIYTSVTQ
jgi:hypothetical protein